MTTEKEKPRPLKKLVAVMNEKGQWEVKITERDPEKNPVTVRDLNLVQRAIQVAASQHRRMKAVQYHQRKEKKDAQANSVG